MNRRGAMNWKVLVAGAALIVPVVWVLASGFGVDPRALPSVLEGRTAPGFALESMEGGTVSLDAMRGKPVVLNFWATWCVPCVVEHPVMLESARRYSEKGVAFYGVLYGDEPARAKEYLRRHGSEYPTLVDPAQRTAIDYGVAGVPETFFIDGQGRIVRKVVGPVDAVTMAETLEAML